MPKSFIIENTEQAGLLTEASKLRFPPQAARDVSNLTLGRDKSWSRRLGLDYEDDYVLLNSLRSLGQAANAVSLTEWENAGGVAFTILVVQAGTNLLFVRKEVASPSTSILNGGLPLTLAYDGQSRIQLTSTQGSAVITAEGLQYPTLLEYDVVSDTVTQQNITVKIRDYYGIEDTIADTVRPTVISSEHLYNLRNQGWIKETDTVSGGVTDPVGQTHSDRGEYPANTDRLALSVVDDVSSADYKKYDTSYLDRTLFGDAPAPKGRFVLGAFTRGLDRFNSVTDNVTLPQDRELGTFKTSAAYSGRIFYSGLRS